MSEVLTQDNIFKLVIDYFSSLNLRNQAEDCFTAKQFESAIAIILPDVCLYTVGSSSHQSHIHITGSNRYFFYPKSIIDTATSSIDYEKRFIKLSKANLNQLNGLSNPRDIGSFDSYTMTKYLVRGDGSVQVQISKKQNGDAKEFLDFRKSLKLHALLVFFKYRDEDVFYIIGIPEEFYSSRYVLPSTPRVSHYLRPKRTAEEVIEGLRKEIDGQEEVSDDADIADYILQQNINDIKDSDTVDIPSVLPPVPYDPSTMGIRNSTRAKTNANMAKSVIKRNCYKCFFETDKSPHQSFETAAGNRYIEAHHIIPIGKQSLFQNKLDTPANIVPLCPSCHAKIHKGKKTEIDAMLDELLSKRCEQLKQSGLFITAETLKELYKR